MRIIPALTMTSSTLFSLMLGDNMKRWMSYLVKGIFLLANTQVFAQNEPKFGCPIAQVFKEPWFNTVVKENNEQYSVFKQRVIDKFDQTWTFRISKIDASSYDDAIEKGKKALATLQGWPSPILVNQAYRCYYEIDYGYQAEAWESKQ